MYLRIYLSKVITPLSPIKVGQMTNFAIKTHKLQLQLTKYIYFPNLSDKRDGNIYKTIP